MQRFLSKYGVAAHLALLAVSPLFLFPYCDSRTTGVVLLWLSLFAAPWILLEPSRRAGEMLHDARLRAAAGILRDPLFWAMLVVVALAGIRWANGGIGLGYDVERGAWHITRPAAEFLPGSAGGAGFLPFAGSVALAVLLTGCRHSLGKSARISFLLTSSALAGTAAIAAAAACFFGHSGALAAAACGTVEASFPGTGFGLYFLAGLASLAGVFECGWNRLLMLAAFSAGASAAGLWFFAPTPVVLAFLAAGVLVLLATCIHAVFRSSPNAAFKCLAVVMIAALVPALCALALAPDSLNEARLAFAQEGGSLFPAGYFESRAALARIARGAFSAHPWIGSGVGAFPLDVRFGATAAEWQHIEIGQANPLDGWLLLAAERGIVGALAFALVSGLLLFTFARRAWLSARGGGLRSAFTPSIALAFASLAALAAETFADSSLFRPECLAALGSFAAIAALSMPARRQDR